MFNMLCKRASVVWLTVFVIAALLACCYCRKDIYNARLQFGGKEQVSYVGLESKYTDKYYIKSQKNNENIKVEVVRLN